MKGNTIGAKRRSLIKSLAAGTAAGVAGCTSLPDLGSDDDENVLVMGTDNELLTLNILKTAGSSLQYLEWIDTGVEITPPPFSTVPWAFEDISMEPDNIGTSEPALTVTVQEGLTWNDGEKVTAEDYAFTIEYVTEQEATGVVRAEDFEVVEDVTYDSPDGRTAHVFISEPYANWRDYIAGTAILPKHQWKDIPDHFAWEPQDPDDLIGSSILKAVDWEFGDYVEYEVRPADEIPWLDEDRIYWIDSDPPYFDKVRFEYFEDHHRMQHAFLNGEIDFLGHGLSFEELQKFKREAEAADRPFSTKEVWESGINFHAFNLRRVPFDDRPFRQLLAVLTDREAIRRSYSNRIAEGTYPAIQQNPDYFPPSPYTMDEYEGIPVPDFRFPGRQGAWELDEDAIQEAREFLLAADGEHDYSFEEAVTDYSNAPDGKELYVDGEPLSEAHTDNHGEPGQGPLEMLYREKDHDRKVRIIQQWVEALRRVGIPVEESVIPYTDQRRRLVNYEDFDMATAKYHGLAFANYFNTLYSSQHADMDSSEDTPRYNFMGYSGADEYIFEARRTVDEEERKDLIKKALVKMWYDVPLIVLFQKREYQIASTEYRGFTLSEGHIHSKGTWLNTEPR